VAAALWETPLAPDTDDVEALTGVPENVIGRLERTATKALIVALWRARIRDDSQLLGTVVLATRCIRTSVWCWRWWHAAGVRSVFGLVAKWVQQALRLVGLHPSLVDSAISRFTSDDFGMPGLGEFLAKWGVGTQVAALGVSPSPGGERGRAC
jgi:hypothetical protein